MASRKNQKKVISKDELRRLMKKKEAEVKSSSRKKIDHPLATYNSLGQLVCSLCNCVVKTDLLWTTHLQSKTHKEKLAALKSRANGPQKPEISRKRKGDSSSESELKKYRGENVDKSKGSLPADFFDSSSKSPAASEKRGVLGLGSYSSSEDSSEEEEPSKGDDSALPADFFDHPSSASEKVEEKVVPKAMAESLPEGFFDDPKMDAKVRQVEYRDKLEDEWEKFQKVMKEENTVSEAIVEEEDEQITVDRNIDEIDEQMQKWKEVNDLAVKKEEIMQHKAEPVAKEKETGEESDVDEDEFMEFLDWRRKKVGK